MEYTANADCAIRLMIRLLKVTRSNSKNMPKPIITAGSFQSPVMKISVLYPNERVADE